MTSFNTFFPQSLYDFFFNFNLFLSFFFGLSSTGSLGAFCKVRQTDKRMLDFYSKLGCFEVAKMEGFPKDIIIMGRSL